MVEKFKDYYCKLTGSTNVWVIQTLCWIPFTEKKILWTFLSKIKSDGCAETFWLKEFVKEINFLGNATFNKNNSLLLLMIFIAYVFGCIKWLSQYFSEEFQSDFYARNFHILCHKLQILCGHSANLAHRIHVKLSIM